MNSHQFHKGKRKQGNEKCAIISITNADGKKKHLRFHG